MSRKPKYAVVALPDDVNIGSLYNLLMSNGYPNVTLCSSLLEHNDVKQLLATRTQIKQRERIPSDSSVEIISTVKEESEIGTLNMDVFASSSTPIIPVYETEVRSVRNPAANLTNSINCRLCDNKIMCTRLSNLTNHVRRHSSVKQYSCIYCAYQHNEMSKVRTHMASQHSDSISTPNDNLTPELQKIWCAYMEKCFPGYLDSQGKTGKNALEVFGGRSLARTDGSANDNDDEIVNIIDTLHNCVECGDAVAGENEMDEVRRNITEVVWDQQFTEHIKLKHNNECNPYRCGECGYLAAYEYIVRRHIAIDHAIIAADVDVELQGTCENYSIFVGKFFPSLDDVAPDMSNELKAFVDTASVSIDDTYQNDFLHRTESVSAEMLLASDTGSENQEPQAIDDPIECSICFSDFDIKDVDGLIAHAKDHYCIKQFECPHCSFASNKLRIVRDHLKNVHNDVGIVIDHNNSLIQQAWMQTMKKCFPGLTQRNVSKPSTLKRKCRRTSK